MQTTNKEGNGKSQPKGVVLIMILGVLTILSLLGIMLNRLTTLERTTSRAFRDSVQARMAAESGIFYGLGRTRGLLSDKGFTDDFLYYGEDLNATGKLDNPLDDQDHDNKLDTYNCPLKRAVHPSFMADLNNDGKLDENDLIEIRGKKVGVSGQMMSTDNKKNFYTIRVADLSSRIYVNMFDHPHLQNILENLAEELGLNRSVGTRIANNRPVMGYDSMGQIKKLANLSDDDYDKISNFITIHAWSDKEVIQPVPLGKRVKSISVGSQLDTWESFRPVRIDFPLRPTQTGYAAGDPAGRAPVNVNTASREVLVALLRGLKGWYLKALTGGGQSNPYDMLFGTTHTGGVALGQVTETPEIDLTTARKIADAIIANRSVKPSDTKHLWEGSFKSWQQFHSFCDNVLWKSPANPNGFLTAQQGDVLKANFNPNSNINSFNPDFQRTYWVDKANLAYHTTEFIFHPHGYFSIDSLGRVLDDNNNLLAEAEIETVVKIFDIYRETDQSDFLYEYWHDGVEIKDKIISSNSNAGLVETTNDLALQTFPELPDKESVKNAKYDGYISLATVENNPATANFRASYNKNGLEPDVGPPFVADVNGPYKDSLVNQGNASNWKPGKLYPDGVYAETDSVPMYQYRPENFDMLTVSMWIKPHYFPEETARTRVYFTYQVYDRGSRRSAFPSTLLGYPYGIYSIWRAGGPPGNESLSQSQYAYGNAWDNASIVACAPAQDPSSMWGGGVGTPSLNHQGHGHDYITRGGQNWGNWLRAGKWIHVGWSHYLPALTHTGWYNYSRPMGHVETYDSSIIDNLYVNGQKVKGRYSMGGEDTYLSGGTGRLSKSTNYLRLGEIKASRYENSAPDATLDEVVVWENLSLQSGGEEIMKIWNDGRYYRGNDGVFTSRKIDLAKESQLTSGTTQETPSSGISPGGDTTPYQPVAAERPITLFLAYWTQYRPDSLPADATCEVSILDENSQPLNTPAFLTDPSGSLIKGYYGDPVTVTKPIRYRVHFRTNAGINNVVLDSLIFDDITLIYYSSPHFVSWQPVP